MKAPHGADAVISHISRFRFSFPHIQFYNTFVIFSKQCKLSLADDGCRISVDIRVVGIDMDGDLGPTPSITLYCTSFTFLARGNMLSKHALNKGF